MVNEVDQLLTAYERGALTRRQLLAGILTSAAAAAGLEAGSTTAAAQARPASPLAGRVRSINHLNVQVSNLRRSAEFYQKLGLPMTLRPIVPAPGEAAYALDLTDGSFLSLIQTSNKERVGIIDHFCLGIDNFRMKEDGDAMRSVGLQPSGAGTLDTFNFVMVRDPDGIRIQVSDAKQRWDCPAGIGKPPCAPV